MAHGRHRPQRSLIGRAGIVLVAVVAAGGVGYAGIRYAEPAIAGGCGSHTLVLPVSAAPDIAPAIASAADRWNATEPRAAGRCVRATVTSIAPGRVLSAMTAQAATPQALTASPPPAGQPSAANVTPPVVWIPNSTSWVDRVRAYNSDAFADVSASVASSPLVVATPADAAKAIGLGASSISPRALIGLLHQMRDGDLSDRPTKFQLGVTDPADDAVGFATAQLLASLDAGKQDGLPEGGALIADYRFTGPIGQDAPDSTTLMSRFGTQAPGWPPMTAAVVSEQAVLAGNRAGNGDEYKALPLTGVPTALDYPVATVAGASPALGEAASAFTAMLATPDSRQILASYGFRTPDGVAGAGFGAHASGSGPVSRLPNPPTAPKPAPIRYDKSTAPVIDLWAAANEEAQVLTLVDVASSMGGLSSYGGLSRLSLTAAAAEAGLKLFTPGSKVGVWGFAPGVTPAGHAELAPLAPLSENDAKVVQSFQHAQATRASGCALYPALADAYKQLRDAYVDGEINTIVVFTDCAEAAPGGTSKSSLLNTLQNMADPAHPIRVVLINVGSTSNDANLKDIAGTVGGSAVRLTRPQDITAIFMGALVALS